MKKSLICATVVASLLALYAVAEAQKSGSPPANGIAVLDTMYVFKNWAGHKARGDAIRKEMEATGAELNKEKGEIQRMMEALKEKKPGSPDYKKLEEDITNRQAKFNVSTQMAKKKIQELDKKNTCESLRELNAAVRDFSVHSGIGLVLQYSGEPLDENNPESISARIGSLVMYQDRKDISDLILEELNRRSPGSDNPRQAGRPSGNAVK